MTEQQILTYLRESSKNLFDKSKSSVDLTLEWERKFPSSSGVYAIFQKNDIIYVGETINIKKRMNNLRNTTNHTLRRTLGKRLFSGQDGFKKATSSVKFPEKVETKLEIWMKKNLSISYLEIKLGRKELEEFIIEENPNILNKHGE